MTAQRGKKRKVAKHDPTSSPAAVATLRHVRMSPRKARLVLDMIRGKDVETAVRMLQFSSKRSSRVVLKLLNSALANARETGGADLDRLWVTGAWADMGKTLRRYMPRAQGRATRIRKRSSHITLQLSEK